MKEWYKSKAMWLGLITLIVSILTFVQGESWVRDYPIVVSVIGTIVGVLTIVIRYFTIEPLKFKRIQQNGEEEKELD